MLNMACPIMVSPGVKRTLLREVHVRNALSPKFMNMRINVLHILSKPIIVTVDGIVTEESCVVPKFISNI